MEKWQRENNVPPDEPRPFLRATRTVIRTGSGYRERLFLFDFDAWDHLADPDRVTTEVAMSFGGEIVAGSEYSCEWGGGVFNVEIFTIKRRSTQTIPDYIHQHSTT